MDVRRLEHRPQSQKGEFMIHDIIERVADKRHQRLIISGIKESAAAKIVTRYLIARKWQYRRDEFTKKIINGLILGYSANLSMEGE